MSEAKGQHPHKRLKAATLALLNLLTCYALAQSSAARTFNEKPYIAPEHLVEIAPGRHLDRFSDPARTRVTWKPCPRICMPWSRLHTLPSLSFWWVILWGE